MIKKTEQFLFCDNEWARLNLILAVSELGVTYYEIEDKNTNKNPLFRLLTPWARSLQAS